MGLMGELARTLTSLSGPDAVHGIIPKALVRYEQSSPQPQNDHHQQQQGTKMGNGDQELLLPDPQIFGHTTLVSSMHERKQLMTELVLQGGPGSGFIALPGGYGTLEELAEVTTWNQLGIHGLGIVVFDVDGFWTPLRGWVDDAVGKGFISEGNRGIVRWAADAEGCLRELREYTVGSGRFDLDWEAR